MPYDPYSAATWTEPERPRSAGMGYILDRVAPVAAQSLDTMGRGLVETSRSNVARQQKAVADFVARQQQMEDTARQRGFSVTDAEWRRRNEVADLDRSFVEKAGFEGVEVDPSKPLVPQVTPEFGRRGAWGEAGQVAPVPTPYGATPEQVRAAQEAAAGRLRLPRGVLPGQVAPAIKTEAGADEAMRKARLGALGRSNRPQPRDQTSDDARIYMDAKTRRLARHKADSAQAQERLRSYARLLPAERRSDFEAWLFSGANPATVPDDSLLQDAGFVAAMKAVPAAPTDEELHVGAMQDLAEFRRGGVAPKDAETEARALIGRAKAAGGVQNLSPAEQKRWAELKAARQGR